MSLQIYQLPFAVERFCQTSLGSAQPAQTTGSTGPPTSLRFWDTLVKADVNCTLRKLDLIIGHFSTRIWNGRNTVKTHSKHISG